MSRSTKNHSSGFFEEHSDNTKHRTAMNEESSSTSDDCRRHNGNGEHVPSSLSPNGHVEDEGEIVEIVDSDDDVANDNNNEAASPDRHRHCQPRDHDSDETARNDSSGSDDDVVVLETSDDETVKLSKIKSNYTLNPLDKVKSTNFEFLKLLGTGAYGRVYLVKKIDGIDKGQLYAMKVLEKKKVTAKKKTIEHTRTEREVLEKIIDCPFLAKMHYAFQSPEKLYLVMDFVQGGELFTHLYNSEHFTENQVRFYIAEIIVALEQLHALKVIYRDIKLENILLDALGHIVITDFGLSKELLNGARATSFCGTIEYMAPEIVSQSAGGHDLNVDWWSVGVLTIELLTGQSPFSRENEESNQGLISNRIQNDPPMIPSAIGKDARDLITKLLEKVPSNRLGYKKDAKDLKEHEFFNLIDWKKLRQKIYKAPMVPKVEGKDDVSQFATDFTQEIAVDKPAEPLTCSYAAELFKGYSFVAPKLRQHPIITETSTNEIPEVNRPTAKDVFKFQEKAEESEFFKRYYIDQSEKPIGDGTYSICMRCEAVGTGTIYAVKIMNLSHDASQEIEALVKCQGHQNIVKLVEHLKDSQYSYIVFELLRGGELFSRIREGGTFAENSARIFFRQIVDAVRFIHEKEIVHRDLKPENIMFVDKEKDELKIVDFGFARRRSSEETAPCYTLDYAAPESLTKGTTKESRDMWSLGVILYTMLIGHTPFMPQDINKQRDEQRYRSKLMENIKQQAFTQGRLWDNTPASAKELIIKLLQVDETKRFKLRDVLDHPWISNDNQNEVESGFEEPTSKPRYLNSVPIEIDDDTNELPPIAETREEVCSNDSSGIVLSDRNEGSSLSSRVEDAEAVIIQVVEDEVEEPKDEPEMAEPAVEPKLKKIMAVKKPKKTKEVKKERVEKKTVVEELIEPPPPVVKKIKASVRKVESKIKEPVKTKAMLKKVEAKVKEPVKENDSKRSKAKNASVPKNVEQPKQTKAVKETRKLRVKEEPRDKKTIVEVLIAPSPPVVKASVKKVESKKIKKPVEKDSKRSQIKKEPKTRKVITRNKKAATAQSCDEDDVVHGFENSAVEKGIGLWKAIFEKQCKASKGRHQPVQQISKRVTRQNTQKVVAQVVKSEGPEEIQMLQSRQLRKRKPEPMQLAQEDLQPEPKKKRGREPKTEAPPKRSRKRKMSQTPAKTEKEAEPKKRRGRAAMDSSQQLQQQTIELPKTRARRKNVVKVEVEPSSHSVMKITMLGEAPATHKMQLQRETNAFTRPILLPFRGIKPERVERAAITYVTASQNGRSSIIEKKEYLRNDQLPKLFTEYKAKMLESLNRSLA